MASSTTPVPHGRRRNAERFGRDLSAGGCVHRVCPAGNRAWRFAIRRSCFFEAGHEPLTDLKPLRTAGSSKVSGSSFRPVRVRSEIGVSASPTRRVSVPAVVVDSSTRASYALRRQRARHDIQRRARGMRRERGDPAAPRLLAAWCAMLSGRSGSWSGSRNFSQRSMEFRRISSSSRLALWVGGCGTKTIRCATGNRRG